MKEIIPMDEYGIFADNHNKVMVNSRFVAQLFEKRHDNVLRDIAELDCSKEFNLLNFEEIKYKDDRGRKQPCVNMTRDGFIFLVMGYKGKKATALKEQYIKRFNEMEAQIKALIEARMDFPLLTYCVSIMHENPKPYHYSNEADMINRIALGMTAKQFRTAHGIEKGKSIRPYLSREQIGLLETLQRADIGLLTSGLDYEQRKLRLEWFTLNLKKDRKEKMLLK